MLLNNWMDTRRVMQRGEWCFYAYVACSAGQMLYCLRLLAQIRRAYDKWFRSQPRKHLKAKSYSSVVWLHWWVLNMMLKALCSGWDGKEEKVSPLDLPMQGGGVKQCFAQGVLSQTLKGFYTSVPIASLLSPVLVRLSQSYWWELKVGCFCIIGCTNRR